MIQQHSEANSAKAYGSRNRTFRTITALILREMSTTYGRSPGGYLWALIEPVAMILLLSLAFSLLLRSPSLGTSFILFYATGYLPFKFYQDTAAKTAGAIRFSKPLLFYPAVTFIDPIIARFTLNLLTQIMVTYIILAGVLWWLDTRIIIDFVPIFTAMALAALLGLGIGTVNCLLFDFFPIWKTAWTVATRPLLLASGVLYIYEDLPRYAADILWYNPLIHITGIMRTGFFPFYNAGYASLPFVLGLALVLCVVGFLLLRRNYKLLLQL